MHWENERKTPHVLSRLLKRPLKNVRVVYCNIFIQLFENKIRVIILCLCQEPLVMMTFCLKKISNQHFPQMASLELNCNLHIRIWLKKTFFPRN